MQTSAALDALEKRAQLAEEKVKELEELACLDSKWMEIAIASKIRIVHMELDQEKNRCGGIECWAREILARLKPVERSKEDKA
jgi:hypothetical protein